MELFNANFRVSLRESAQRLGLAEFWRWWTSELRGLLPRGLRTSMQRWRMRPVIVFRPDAAVVLAPRSQEGGVAYVEVARVPVRAEAAEVAQAGRAAVEALGRAGRRTGPGAPRVVIALERGQVLRKRLTYPAPAEANLAQVLGYDLDRHTPFKAEDLYYDAMVVGRDPARNEIRVELVAALRSLVDQLRRQAAAWGAEVVAVVPEAPSAERPVSRLNLLPEAERTHGSAWHRLRTGVPIAIVVLLVAAAIVVPIAQKRAEAITLLHASEQAQLRAAAADALRTQLEQFVEDYNFVLSRKYGYPSTLQLLDDVTRLLPDDTWLTQFELKSTKGKDAHREIQLRGESANAGRLVSLLEDSQLFDQAAPRSPITKIQPGPGEIFDLGAQVKPLALPATQLARNAGPLAPAAAPPASPPPAANATPGASAATSPASSAPTRAPAAAPASGPAPKPAPRVDAPANAPTVAPPSAAPAPAPPRPAVTVPESTGPRFGPRPPGENG